MRRFLFVLCAMFAPHGAQAQEFLTQSELEGIFSLNALCYNARDNGNCAWAEVYPVLDGPMIELDIGFLLDTRDMVVLHQHATWINDAMCIRDRDLGVVSSAQAATDVFPFDGGGLIPQAQAETDIIVAQIAAAILPKTCFRFARNPARVNGLVMVTFADGVRQAGDQAITLLPLASGSARLYLQF